MHERRRNKHHLWLVGQIHIFGIFEFFFFGLEKKSTPRRVHLLAPIVVTLPVSHLDKSEVKTDAERNAAKSVSQHSKRTTTPHTQRNTTSPQKNKKKCESPIFTTQKRVPCTCTLTLLHIGHLARLPLRQI